MSQLDWPDGYERTPASERDPYPHGFRVSRADAFDNILEELRHMDAKNVRVETAAPHTKAEPHRPYHDRDPEDPSVVVYAEYDGQQLAVPCDLWDNLRDNAQAIAKYLNAKRALERYGVATVESEFSTQALPSGNGAEAADPPAHEVLGIAPDAPEAVVRTAYQEAMKDAHPDQGGSAVRKGRVQRAKEAMLDG